MGTGRGRTPAAALGTATEHLQTAGSAQQADRQAVLRGQPDSADPRDGDVQIAHFDVVDVTGSVTDRVDAYTAFTHVERVHVELMSHLHATHDALTFFVGGDNFISVCPSLDRRAYEETVEHVSESVGADLRVGVGRGATACDAGLDAKVALEECRDRDLIVSGDLPAVTER